MGVCVHGDACPAMSHLAGYGTNVDARGDQERACHVPEGVRLDARQVVLITEPAKEIVHALRVQIAAVPAGEDQIVVGFAFAFPGGSQREASFGFFG